jgi:hypothetical protein
VEINCVEINCVGASPRRTPTGAAETWLPWRMERAAWWDSSCSRRRTCIWIVLVGGPVQRKRFWGWMRRSEEFASVEERMRRLRLGRRAVEINCVGASPRRTPTGAAETWLPWHVERAAWWDSITAGGEPVFGLC